MTWHEPEKNQQGKAKRHSEVAQKSVLSTTLRTPMIVKDFDYFMNKFNLTPKSDVRVKSRGRLTSKGQIIINVGEERVKWHELGHLIARDIITQEFSRKGEMVLSNSFRTLQITDEELRTLKTLLKDDDLYKQIDDLNQDLYKIENNISPYDKIPKSEMSRIRKDYKDGISTLKKTLEYNKKPNEIFADYFASYHILPIETVSSLPRLSGIWLELIDNYMDKV